MSEQKQMKISVHLQLLQNAAQALRLVDIKILRDNIRNIDTLMPVLDPTAWMKSRTFMKDYERLVDVMGSACDGLKEWEEEFKASQEPT